MAYNANIPQPGDRLKDSQPQLLANFQELKTFLELNHGDFASADQGKHVLVSLPSNVVPPVVAAGDDAIYATPYVPSGQTEIMFHSQKFAGPQAYPGTASILSTQTPAMAATGWTYFPSGILMHWGSFGGTGDTVLTVDATYPPFTQILTVIVCAADGTAGDVDFAVRLRAILSNTQFAVYFSSRTAVGPAAGNGSALIIGY